MKKQLAECLSVSVVSDGWTDKAVTQWLGLSVSFIYEWQVSVLHLDLIPTSTSCTAELICYLIKDTVSRVYLTLSFLISFCLILFHLFTPPYLNSECVSSTCMIASTTTDGAPNELKGGEGVVKLRNNLHCSCHIIQGSPWKTGTGNAS